MGSYRIYGAAVVEEKTLTGVILFDAETVIERIEVGVDKLLDRQLQVGGDLFRFLRRDRYGAGFTDTASTTFLTGEAQAAIEKIGPQRDGIRQIHDGTISETPARIKCHPPLHARHHEQHR